jgi:hypothetical protein
VDTENIKKHIREDVEYPTTAMALKEACNNLEDFSAEDKKWFTDTLPEGTYNTPEDVVKALGW